MDWTDARSADADFVDVVDRRQSGTRLAPFKVERVDYRDSDLGSFFKGLERNGPNADEDYRVFKNL